MVKKTHIGLVVENGRGEKVVVKEITSKKLFVAENGKNYWREGWSLTDKMKELTAE